MLENYIKMISNDKNDKILSLRFNSFEDKKSNFFEDFSPSAKYPVRLMFDNRKDIGQIGLIKLSVV